MVKIVIEVLFKVRIEVNCCLLSKTQALTSIIDDFWAITTSQNNGGDIIISMINSIA